MIKHASDRPGAHKSFASKTAAALELDRGHGVRTLYAHLSEIDPKPRMGRLGGGGRRRRAHGRDRQRRRRHLHYEIIIEGTPVDALSGAADPPIW